MIQLLIRADDLGYSEAVNYGIEKSVKDGMIRTVGLMPNMEAAEHGLGLLKGPDLCIGQHTNICLGKPCADPELIPSLLDENGYLKTSAEYRAAMRDNREIAKVEELVIEIEAQYHRFVKIVGNDPDYFEGHAVMSKNVSRALEIVAERYSLPYNNISPVEPVGKFDGKSFASCPLKSMSPDYDAVQSLKEAVINAREDMPNVYVCHPGYVDMYLMETSFITINRAKEVEMLCSPAMREWLKEQKVELITYRDI